MTTKEKTVLSTEEKMRQVTEISKEEKSLQSHKFSSVVAAIITAALLAGAKPAMPQTAKDALVQDSIKTEAPKKEAPKWAFFVDPSYSPTDKVGSMRLSWAEASMESRSVDSWILREPLMIQ